MSGRGRPQAPGRAVDNGERQGHAIRALDTQRWPGGAVLARMISSGAMICCTTVSAAPPTRLRSWVRQPLARAEKSCLTVVSAGIS